MKCNICGYDRNESLRKCVIAEVRWLICPRCEKELLSVIKHMEREGFDDRRQDSVYEMQQYDRIKK